MFIAGPSCVTKDIIVHSILRLMKEIPQKCLILCLSHMKLEIIAESQCEWYLHRAVIVLTAKSHTYIRDGYG